MILLFWFPIQGLICIWLNTKATYQKLLELYNSASPYVTYVKKWFIAISYLTIHSSNIQRRSQISAKFASIKVQNLTLFSQVFFQIFFSDCFEDWADLILSLYLPCLQCELEMVATSPLCIAGFTEKPKKINRLFRWIDREQFLQSTCDFTQVGRWATPQPLSHSPSSK